MSNVACRIFKEQIDLLLSLPSQEEAKTVLYYALINSLNQFENHFDNQIENQNENAYVSVSVSELSKSILNLLSKNIVWKEFSNNYGGKREGVGRPKKPLGLPSEKPLGLASENLPENENENKNKNETVFIDEHTRIDEQMPEFNDMTYEECCRAFEWLQEKMYCQSLSKSKFIEIVRKFKGFENGNKR